MLNKQASGQVPRKNQTIDRIVIVTLSFRQQRVVIEGKKFSSCLPC